LTNISKNIKKLRTEKKLTQEQLAERISVTRQTISSWETNRTQPDIDMLAALSEALETDIEELIYGKKKNIGLEPDNTRNRKTLSTVLIIMGSLLSAVGAIFLFVYFWQEIPGAAKTVMAFLPLAAGAAFAMFTLIKKRDSLAFRESAAVIWTAGVFATNALVNSIFNADFGFENLLLAGSVLVLPAVFLLDSVFLFTLETVISSIAIFVDEINENNFLLISFLAVWAVSSVFVFTCKHERPVKQYAAWLALLSAGAHAAFISLAIDYDFRPFATVVGIFFLAMYIAEKSRMFELSLKLPAVSVLCAGLLALAIVSAIDDDIQDFTGKNIAFSLVWAFLCLVPAFITGRESYRKNTLKKVFTAVFLVFLAAMFVMPRLYFGVMWAFSAAAGVLLVISGVQKGKISICNFGMINIAVDIILFLAKLYDLNFLSYGALFLFLGIVFLLTNRVMLKKLKKPVNEISQAEEADKIA